MTNYNKDLKERLLKQQILVLEDLIDKMERSKEVVKQFEGKQCNVRLGRALENIETESKRESTRYKNGYNGIGYDNYVIYYSTTIDEVVKINPGEEYSSCAYVSINCKGVPVSLYAETKKINANKTIEYIDSKIEKLQSEIQEIKISILQICEMLDDYEHIKERVERFQNKYSIWIREELNIRFY